MHKLMLLIISLLEKILMFAMAVIVLTVTWQVFSRFIIQSPSSFTEELSRFLLIWIGVLGSAYAYKTKAHLGLDLFVEKMAPLKQKRVRILIECLVLFFAGSVMVYGGSLLVAMTVELKQTTAALELNMGLIYLAVPLSGVLIVMFCIDNISQLLKSTITTINTVEGEL